MNAPGVSRELEMLSAASEAVSQLFTAAGKEMTGLEVNLWLRAIGQYGPDLTLAFVEFWMMGGGHERYRRAPTLEDFRRRVDPNYVSTEDALEILRAEVVRSGPYANPVIHDKRLSQSINIMGGWAKVCQELPDANETFALKRFAERFASAWVQAEGRVIRDEAVEPLLGLADQRLQRGTLPLEQVQEVACVSGPQPT